MKTRSMRRVEAPLVPVGRAIRWLREAAGLRLSQLAKDARLSTSYLSLIENREREPSLAALERLTRQLGIPLETLLVLSQPKGGMLKTENTTANKLAEAILAVADAEKLLKKALQKARPKE